MNPDFLIIGAQKAGTTWLFQNLQAHPEIWLPPEKEIHFFDLPPLMPMYWLLFAPLKKARAWIWNRMVRDWNKVKRGEGALWWYWKYYFFPRSWWWYESLFTPGPTQICGEATPRYATLREKQIRKIQKRLPHLKIIYLLRDPIDRMWSDAAMQYAPRFGAGGIENTDVAHVKFFMKSPENLAHSKYFENLKRWENCLGSEAIFFAFQEQVIDDPASLMKEVFSFLGVSQDIRIPLEVAQRKVNKNTYPSIPQDIERMLASALREDLKRLHGKFNNSSTWKWLSRMRAIA